MKWIVISCFWLWGITGPAVAQRLTFSGQAEFQLIEERYRDQPGNTFTGFTPMLNISYLSPVKPGADLYVDAQLGLAQDYFRFSRQTSGDLRLILRGEDPRYRVSVRLGKSQFRNEVSVSGLEPVRLKSETTETGITAIIREPSYPTVNVQWTKYKAKSDFIGAEASTTTTTSRLAAFYDMRPLHFRYDQSHRLIESPQGANSDATSRRMGVSVDTELMPRLNLFGDVQFGDIKNKLGDETNGQTDQLMVWRLSGFPTPSVVLDAEYFSQASERLNSKSQASDTNSTGTALRMRSEFMPGVQLNLSRDSQHTERGDIAVDSTTTLADIFAQVDARNNAALSLSQQKSENNKGLNDTQTTARMSWVSQLDSRTDAVMSVDRYTTKTSLVGDNQTSSVNLALRYRPDYQTTLGIGYLISKSTTERVGGNIKQDLRSIDLDFSWLPTYDLTIGGRLSLSQLSGDTEAQFLVPSLDIRWQADSRTDIGLNWRAQTSKVRNGGESSSFDQNLFSGRLRHHLSSFSDLDITYDVIQSNQGSLELERVMRIVFTTRW